MQYKNITLALVLLASTAIVSASNPGDSTVPSNTSEPENKGPSTPTQDNSGSSSNTSEPENKGPSTPTENEKKEKLDDNSVPSNTSEPEKKDKITPTEMKAEENSVLSSNTTGTGNKNLNETENNDKLKNDLNGTEINTEAPNKPWYTSTLFMVACGVVGLSALGGGIYMMTNKSGNTDL